MSPKLLTEQEVAKWLQCAVPTLRSMRSRPGKDPIPYVKIGSRVRYSEEDIRKWIQRNTFQDSFEAREHRNTG